jgi:hypothetical protein
MTTRPIESIEPADCFVRAMHLANEVELIRREMGRPADARPPITVTGASPRECWFQALATFRKADRLCHEIANDPTASVPHAPPIGDIKPGHVLAVIEASARELDETKKALGIPEHRDPPARDPAKQPSDVFGALATVNRQINRLLERPFSPADVFQQVSFAVAYAARLPGSTLPAEPAFVRGKRPVDCYQRLAACLDAARTLVRRAGHAVIDRPSGPGDELEVLPSDVFDMATLVLGEVAFLHALNPDPNPPYPFEGNTPGRKLPSHVFQLAGVLEQQLAQLAR